MSFTAVEDASIVSTDPDSNFGSASSLRVENNPAAEWALLKFHLTGIPRDARVTSATLRLYAVSDAADAGSVYAIEEDWSETGVTWANAPAVGRKLADLPGPAQAGSWIEVDVTPDVAGGADLDLYVMSWGSDPVTYASREAKSTAPTLRVRWSRDGRSTPTLRSTPTSAPTAVPTPAPSLTPTPAPGLTPTPAPGLTPTPAPGLTPTPAPSPTSTAEPGRSFQPEPPIQAAFFYPWFSEAWEQQGLYPYTNYTPSLGLYDSSDGALIDQQLQMAARAHIEAFIASWWGQGHHTDTSLQYILDYATRSDSPYQDMRWAVYHEPEGYGDPSVSEIVSDLEYLEQLFSRSGYLRVNGRPVVFVYGDAADGCDMVERWVKAKALVPSSPYIVLKVFSGYRTCGSQPDSWHQYGPAAPYDAQLPYSVSVSPGFWKAGEAPRLARDAGRFESDVQRMVDSGAFWQLVTTWNEWGEGSIVEAAAEFGDTYVDILCRNISGAAACSTSGATPGLTPTPTPGLIPAPTPEPLPTPTPSPPPSAPSS
ncbi:MAG: DNRLRE domain-containing protein, partial [Dehalococcoidia bacterium]